MKSDNNHITQNMWTNSLTHWHLSISYIQECNLWMNLNWVFVYQFYFLLTEVYYETKAVKVPKNGALLLRLQWKLVTWILKFSSHCLLGALKATMTKALETLLLITLHNLEHSHLQQSGPDSQLPLGHRHIYRIVPHLLRVSPGAPPTNPLVDTCPGLSTFYGLL